MNLLLKFSLLFSLLTLTLYAEREKVKASIVISGGVSLGAYESGYNWALIKMVNKLRTANTPLKPDLRSIAGASAGAINSALSAMYWCQKDSIPLKNTVDDNLFYDTWVNLDLQDLLIPGKDPNNNSTLFSRRALVEKGKKIIEHMEQPIYRKNCEIPLGITVTKAVPIVEDVGGMKMKNQHFSIPFTFKEENGKAIVENREMPESESFYISIPNIENDRTKLIDVLFASSAFPGAFQQVKLDYAYKGKNYSHYFVDGGVYDNVPLDLAVNLDSQASLFFFLDPSNVRKEKEVIKEKEEKEPVPVGFISTNMAPILGSAEIYQSMMLYKAFNKHIRYNPDRSLVRSSRYHPITGQFLAHFGAFFDLNFRIYDYYVGVYDAIYRIAASFRKRSHYAHMSQTELMNILKTILGLDENPEALAAYNLFLNTEFNNLRPKTTDRFSAIYNAFNLKKPDIDRYDTEEFKAFLSKLDLNYLEKTSGMARLAYVKEDIDNWYRKPAREILARIATLENIRTEIYPDNASVSTGVSAGIWAGNTFIKEKRGLKLLPFDVPEDEDKKGLRTALRFLPNDLSIDAVNGGMSLGYNALYYTKSDMIDGIEGKASYILTHGAPDFIRGDLGIFKEYNDAVKFGAGASFFGDMEGSFYKRDTAFGFNTYIDVLDIFRVTYVRREGEILDNDYLYFGIENIPSLLYWLTR
jgi:predicted acylesterase/phospholipase RssA